jgi:ubiquinone/menaquinone biosynthesis C-methylase UbiE
VLVPALPRVSGAVERLDAPGTAPDAVRGSLDDLARINRLFRGTRLTLAAVADLGPVGSALDVGCGGGEIAEALARAGLDVVAVDASPAIAALARERHPGLDVRVGDLRGLLFDDGAVDVAACSLVLHHLEPPDAVRALRELRRVARAGVVVNDLVRTRLGLLGAHAVSRLLTRNPVTRHDAVLSVRRAYTCAELLALVREAGLEPVRVRRALGYRVAVAAVHA